MASSMAPNKSLSDKDRLVQKLTPEQLKQLIQQNPQSTEATLALARLNEIKEFSERGKGMQGEAPSVKDQILNYNHGIGNLPMQPPSPAVMAAQGGLINFQDRGLVEEPTYLDRFDDGFQFNDLTGFAGDVGGDAWEYTKENPGTVAATTALTLATLPLSAPVAAGAGALRLGAMGLGALARTPVGQKIGQYGGNFVAKQGSKITDKVKKYMEGKLKKQLGKPPKPAGKQPVKPKDVFEPKKLRGQRKNETDVKFKVRKDKYDKEKKDWDAWQNKKYGWQKQQTQQIKYRKDFDKAREAQRLRNLRLSLGLGGTAGFVAAGSGGEEEPLTTMQGLPEMGLPRGSEAVKDPNAGMSMEPKKRSFASNALIAGGLEYASNPNANIGSAAKTGFEYADSRRNQMTDREKLEFDRKTRMGVAEIGLQKAMQLNPANRLRIMGLLDKYRGGLGMGSLNQDMQTFNKVHEDLASKLDGLNMLHSEIGRASISDAELQSLGGGDTKAALEMYLQSALVERRQLQLTLAAGGATG